MLSIATPSVRLNSAGQQLATTLVFLPQGNVATNSGARRKSSVHQLHHRRPQHHHVHAYRKKSAKSWSQRGRVVQPTQGFPSQHERFDSLQMSTSAQQHQVSRPHHTKPSHNMEIVLELSGMVKFNDDWGVP